VSNRLSAFQQITITAKAVHLYVTYYQSQIAHLIAVCLVASTMENENEENVASEYHIWLKRVIWSKIESSVENSTNCLHRTAL